MYTRLENIYASHFAYLLFVPRVSAAGLSDDLIRSDQICPLGSARLGSVRVERIRGEWMDASEFHC